MTPERRSKLANDGRPPTPPSSPDSTEQDLDYDTSDPDRTSGEFTDSATPYLEMYFPIPTRRMFRNFDRLRQRSIMNTRIVDMDALRALGVYREFLRLTCRVGFTPQFWAIEGDSYSEKVQEFLSSLQLKTNSNGQLYIKFQLQHNIHRVDLDTLRGWFGFRDNPQTDELNFREGISKDDFWHQITGTRVSHSREYRARAITHPALRIIQRILACTIFARGETINRANTEDLMMLDNMLRPDSELVYPDLMLVMVRHWLGIQRSTRTGGDITIGAYVTFIGEKLGIDMHGDDICGGPNTLDAEAYRLGLFIRIERGVAGHPDRYHWLACRTDRLMPFPAPISLTDSTTWLYVPPVDPAAAPVAPPARRATRRVPRPAPPPDDTHMADIPSSSHQAPEPSLGDIYHLLQGVSVTQRQQGFILSDIQEQLHLQDARLGGIEDELLDWGRRFPPGTGPPGL